MDGDLIIDMNYNSNIWYAMRHRNQHKSFHSEENEFWITCICSYYEYSTVYKYTEN